MIPSSPPGAYLLAALVVLSVALFTCGCLQPAAAATPFTYVAIGASDAVGVGAASPETEGWVPRLGTLLGPDVRVVNLGVNGSTLEQAIKEQLGPAVDAQPDLVTIWLAVNDLNARVPLQRYESELDQLLTDVSQDGRCVLVGNVPDLTRAPAYAGTDPQSLQTIIQSWNTVISSVVLRHGARLVDLYARWQEMTERPELISADGFHPSSAGYERLAAVFLEDYHRGC
ncbi:MAG TPA: SGNH/GDSL hydrolase family protein [Chloroflexota bacterium]|nr:SGNH/GDSL hydrolase family protein [Chloroflexota bacterium]